MTRTPIQGTSAASCGLDDHSGNKSRWISADNTGPWQKALMVGKSLCWEWRQIYINRPSMRAEFVQKLLVSVSQSVLPQSTLTPHAPTPNPNAFSPIVLRGKNEDQPTTRSPLWREGERTKPARFFPLVAVSGVILGELVHYSGVCVCGGGGGGGGGGGRVKLPSIHLWPKSV